MICGGRYTLLPSSPPPLLLSSTPPLLFPPSHPFLLTTSFHHLPPLPLYVSSSTRPTETNIFRRYSKQEGLGINYTQFTHLLSPTRDIEGFETIHEELGFEQINWREFPREPLIQKVPRIFVLKRKGLPAPVSPARVVDHVEDDVAGDKRPGTAE